jgi:hypothetical protein
VNYGGSTGYGRPYRMRLRKQWGIVDVDDCCNAAKYLASQGLADPERLCIDGGSAGGYTTLACLAFRCGVAGSCALLEHNLPACVAQPCAGLASQYARAVLRCPPKQGRVCGGRLPLRRG